jgi:hypothetical protein
MSLRRYLSYSLAIPIMALLAAALTGRAYWGHWFSPPSSDSTVRVLSQLDTFSSVWSASSASGPEALLAAGRDANHTAGESPYARLPAALIAAGLRPTSSAPVPAHLLPGVIAALREAGELREGAAGYPNAADLHGHLAVGRSPGGEAVVVAALGGREASKDHYPYYEAVLSEGPNGSLAPRHLRFYWYDVAGLEGILIGSLRLLPPSSSEHFGYCWASSSRLLPC